MKQINEILEEMVKNIDISPSDYKRAVASYKAVGDWLENGYEDNCYLQSNAKPEIYPQGSINLGTIVRPIRDGKEADYDIDLVCELKPVSEMSAYDVKNQVGNRLKNNELYKNKLDKEGKRCWTLEYAETEGIGFHIDILPCIPENNNANSNIKITHKSDEKIYEWKFSNPKGYAEWFSSKNKISETVLRNQKKYFFENSFNEDGSSVFKSVDEVPSQLVKTPLQRAIQIMKRHRDVYFCNNPKIKPISVIITTLAAKIYDGEQDIMQTLTNIINTLNTHAGYIENKNYVISNNSIAERKLISRRLNENGVWEWYIPNPINEKENFADKWHENNDAKAKEFFKWVAQIKKDFDEMESFEKVEELQTIFKNSFVWNISDKMIGGISQNQSTISFPKTEIKKETANQPWKEK